MRTSSKKSSKNKNDNITGNNITTTTTTTISNSSNITNSNLTENSRFLLPADSVTNIVVVGDKGVGKSGEVGGMRCVSQGSAGLSHSCLGIVDFFFIL